MPERLLRYWREDPLLNDHHWHWHLVYPYAGRPDRTKYSEDELLRLSKSDEEPEFLLWDDRHGELFAYMHCQLLARYAAERLSVGLPPQTPLDDYRSPISEGYEPGVVLTLEGEQLRVSGRPDNVVLGNLEPPNKWSNRPGAQIANQERFRNRLLATLSAPSAKNRATTLSELAERIESTGRNSSSYFGALHNDGHLLISMYNNDDKSPGVLYYEQSAVRDPVFYRWHSHIDQMFETYQNTAGPQEFLDLPDIRAQAFAIVSGSERKNVIDTFMRTRTIAAETPGHMEIDYLAHEGFWYVIRADNPSSSAVEVVVRIFMVPEEWIDRRRAWIEMDKFKYELPPGSHVFERSSKSSSVVRHPIQTSGVLEGTEPPSVELNMNPGCRCGWPYTLLIPRGTAAGLPCRFMVLLSAGSDLSRNLQDPSSASYCGLRDSEYPDRRPMGYPFDRPFVESISEWVSGAMQPKQVASASVAVVHHSEAVHR